MPAKTLRATVALATLAAVQACEICHLHYFHKDVASPTAMTSSSYCREYQSQACCTTEVASGVGDAQTGYLYPDHNPADGCGQLSSACEKFFIEEGCFYECDHNVGKWRAHDDCGADGTGNEWQIEAMPIKASYCDAWYEACRGADNKLCMGSASTEGAPQYGYFAQPTCHEEQGTGGCKRIDEVYTSGFHMCETMWAGSFRYENDTSADAYVMSFDEGTANPNNAVFQNKNYPTVCPVSIGGGVNMTLAAEEGCDVDVVAIGGDVNLTLAAEEGRYDLDTILLIESQSGATRQSARAFGAAVAIAAASVLLA